MWPVCYCTRNNGFEVLSMDGVSSGSVKCADTHEVSDWVSGINNNIMAQNNRSVSTANGQCANTWPRTIDQ